MKILDNIIKCAALIILPLMGCLSLLSCTQKTPVPAAYTDDNLIVTITPGELVLLKEYAKADALVIQWEWIAESEFDNNPEVMFTLELAEADTDFDNPSYFELGRNELDGERFFSVEELNTMLIKNGVLDNGGKGEVEARIIATIGSVKGCRSMPVRFNVSTYYLDPRELPPYERIWFVGSWTGWKFIEMERSDENPFVFFIDFTFDPEVEAEHIPNAADRQHSFKFAVHEAGSIDEYGTEVTWYDMYHPEYPEAPITENKAVQVHSDVSNDFKWKVEEKYWGQSFRISLDITPGKETMTCTALGDTPVTPPDSPDNPDEPDTPDNPDGPQTPDDAEPFSLVFQAVDCAIGGTAVKENGRVEGINVYREGYINIEFDAPYDGIYTFILTVDCWVNEDFSFAVTDGYGTKTIHVITPTIVNSTFEYRCDIKLKKGYNMVTISGGEGIMDGWAPNFHKFVISNGLGNFPGDGAENDDQGDF